MGDYGEAGGVRTYYETQGTGDPVLLMQGDDDCVRIERSAAVARAIPDAQLAIIPGASHTVPRRNRTWSTVSSSSSSPMSRYPR